jgi:hypothetical protein
MIKHRICQAFMTIGLIVASVVPLSVSTTIHAQDGTPITCPGFMPSRLVAGGMARDLPSGTPILMGEIDPAPARPTVLQDGVTVMVLSGPECMYDTAQWHVDYNGTVGWLAEGEGQTYWLEPLPLPELGATYVTGDRAVQFSYPKGWNVVEQNGAEFVLEPGLTQLKTGHFIVAVYPDTHLVASLANSEGTPLTLLQMDAAAGAQQGVTYTEPVPLMFGDYMAAYAYITSPSLGMDSLEFVVEVSFGKSAMLSVLTLPGEIATGVPTALAMVQTLKIPREQAPQGEGLDLSGIGALVSGSPAAGTGPTATYVSPDASFSFDYPADWIVAPLENNTVLIVNDEAVYNVSDLNALVPEQLIGVIYPTLADTPDYPVDPSGSNTTASTVVSYYASMGMVSGYVQEGSMEVFTLAQRDASSSLAHATGHDRLVIAIQNGKGDFAVLIAYAAAGEMATYQADLTALMGTVNAP